MYGAFNASVLGMKSQSHALNVLGDNIANVNSGGYKRTDVNFSSLISRNATSQQMGGVKPHDVTRIGASGMIAATQRNLDVAISGEGFFILNTLPDGSGQTYYTRDGSFDVKTVNVYSQKNPDGSDITVPTGYSVDSAGFIVDSTTGDDGNATNVPVGYLKDKNGYFVMGWAANPDGSFPTSGAMQALRLDTFAFADVGQESTDASLNLNLDATAPRGDVYKYDIDVFDTNGERKTLQLQFTKQNAANTWELDLIVPNALTHDLTPGSTTPTSLTSGLGAGTELVFDPASDTITAQAAGGGAAVAGFFATGNEYITISGSGSSDGKYRIKSVSQDGSTIELDERTPLAGTAGTDTADIDLTLETTANTVTFDSFGALTSTGTLTLDIEWLDGGTNAVTLDVSELTQYSGFYNPVLYTKTGYGKNELTSISFDQQGYVIGQFDDDTHRSLYRMPVAVFSNQDGLETRNGMVFAETEESGVPAVRLPGSVGAAYFSGGAREYSNVDLADQFSKMVITHSAYNACAKVFKAVDEVTVKAGDLVG